MLSEGGGERRCGYETEFPEIGGCASVEIGTWDFARFVRHSAAS